MTRLHTDLSRVPVSVAPSPATSGTSLGVTDANAAYLPDTYPYWAVLVPTGAAPTRSNSEIVKVTGGSSSAGTTTLTVTRAQGIPVTTAQTVTTSFDIYDANSVEALPQVSSSVTETPSGSVNSSNTTFTLSQTPTSGTVKLFQNGIRLKLTEDYTISGLTITMNTAPITGDLLLADYSIVSGTFSVGSTSFITNETPSGTINGSNAAFVTAFTYVAGSIQVYRDGQLMKGGGADYTETDSNTITFVTAPVTGSVLLVSYQYAVSTAGNADTLDGYHANATPTVGQVPVLDSNMAMIGEGLGKQIIRNGNFEVSQVATTFVAGANNDDVYTLDGWNLISDGNDTFDVSQEAITDLPGSNYALKLDVETSKRGGVVQFIEAKDAQKLKGKVVSLSFAVKSANIAAIRATVLSWSSTADSVTSDVVTTWGATPTWAANWADNATPADLTVTSSWTTVKIENIAIDEATVNNLALAIWLPNEETIGDIVYISQVKMNLGDKALPFNPRAYEEELKKCQRFCFVPETSQIVATLGLGFAYSTTIAFVPLKYPVKMRVIPTLTATAGDWQLGDFGAAYDLTAIDNTTDAVRQTADAAILRCTVASGLTANRPYVLQCDSAANRIMIFRSEL